MLYSFPNFEDSELNLAGTLRSVFPHNLNPLKHTLHSISGYLNHIKVKRRGFELVHIHRIYGVLNPVKKISIILLVYLYVICDHRHSLRGKVYDLLF